MNSQSVRNGAALCHRCCQISAVLRKKVDNPPQMVRQKRQRLLPGCSFFCAAEELPKTAYAFCRSDSNKRKTFRMYGYYPYI
jgi:hypothetical protein